MATVLEGFAEYLVSSVPDDLLSLARMHLFDGLFAALVGMATPHGELVRNQLEKESSSGPGWVPKVAAGASVVDATRALARIIRCTEIDDIQLEALTTPSAIVIPAALGAAAAVEDRSAEDLLRAIVCGYEAVERLGRAAGGLSSDTWLSFVVAGLGAAAVGGLLFGGNAADLAGALALVGPLIPMWRPTGEDARMFGFGAMVASGLSAAFASASGADGTRSLLETAPLREDDSPYFDTELLSKGGVFGIGEGLRAARIKLWCSSAQVAGAVDALLYLADKFQITADQIDHIEVAVPSWCIRMIDQPTLPSQPRAGRGAQYQLASALMYPDDLWDCRRLTLRTDPEFVQLTRRISVGVDRTFETDAFGSWPARVGVTTSMGEKREFTSASRSPSQDWSWEKVSEKAQKIDRCCDTALDVAKLEHLVQTFSTTHELLEGLRTF